MPFQNHLLGVALSCYHNWSYLELLALLTQLQKLQLNIAMHIFTGNQLVQGRHSQKVHSGESVGANHHSKFHSEVRVSHETSHPTANPYFANQTQQSVVPHVHRKNSRPVRTTTHQWPPAEYFHDPKLHFNTNFPGFESNKPLQRLFRPEYDPTADMRLKPGFERFFESINDFGPQSRLLNGQNTETGLAMFPTTTSQQIDNDGGADAISDKHSETSSIRSSASAYWPPELKFLSTGDESDAVSWKFRKPVMKLRRISPPGNRRER